MRIQQIICADLDVYGDMESQLLNDGMGYGGVFIYSRKKVLIKVKIFIKFMLKTDTNKGFF